MRSFVRIAIGAAAAVAGVGALAACSAVLGVQSDRYVVAADADDGASSATTADWSCLGTTPPPAVVGQVELKLLLNDVTTMQSSGSFQGTPIPFAQLRPCSKLDFDCSNPLTTVTSDDGGVVLLTLPSGFDGYYEVMEQDYTPSIILRSPQRQNEYSLQGLAKASLLALGAGLAHVTADPDKAISIVTTEDCGSIPAPGVQFTIGAQAPEEQLVYLENSLPSGSATETDYTGSAIIFNVPPGTMTVTSSVAGDGRTIRTVDAIARKGWITFIQIRSDSSRITPLDATIN